MPCSMEPRVSNLLLLERLPAERHTSDGHATANNPHGVLFPSATLPAIRPLLHEDQNVHVHSYSNEIDSLTLPEIDWEALNIVLDSAPPLTNPGPSASNPIESGTTKAKRQAKAGAPLAEVLNANSPEVRHAQVVQDEFAEPENRKRRRIDGPVTRTLPRPSPATKKSSKRHPFLPPLLVPLHEPPPNAGLIPSMATEGFRERMDKIPSREALRAGNKAISPQPLSTSASFDRSVEKPEEPRHNQTAKNRRARHSWTDRETKDLLLGVAKFGIGSWKKILEHSDYHFNGRTAVDLKDRFRTICPDEYRKSGAEKGQPNEAPPPPTKGSFKKSARTPANPASTREPEPVSNTEPSKMPDELARLGISGPFPKSQRRARRGFTTEEDDALLQGFNKYGARWTKIQSDAKLGLDTRSRTDLRDRFRNKFPEKFIETGHKFKMKEGEITKDVHETEKEDVFAPSRQAPSSLTSSAEKQPQAPMVTTSNISASQHSLKLLTSSFTMPAYFNDLGEVTPEDDDDPATITLSRNIFEWADQNSARVTAPRLENTAATQLELSTTITTMDELLLDPTLEDRSLVESSTMRDGVVAAPSNLFPQLPLSGILNGPVSLPSAAELVSGVDAEGRLEY